MIKTLPLLLTSLLAPLSFGAQSVFDSSQNTWVLSNSTFQAIFQLTDTGLFRTQSLTDLSNGDRWTPSATHPASPIRFQAGGNIFDAQRQYVLTDQYTQPATPAGVRQFIVLTDLQNAAQITLILDLYDGQPVLRYSLRYRNLTGAPAYITAIDMLPWAFADYGQRFTAFRVNQWSLTSRPSDFEQLQTVLGLDGAAVEIYSGAEGQQCGWLAVRDSNSRGLFAGWEFDGRTKATVQHEGAEGYLQFSASILDLNHPVQPFGDFDTPHGFLGMFHGDFDEAGYRTQRFVEAVIAKPAPSPATFPFIAWDSWAYGKQLDEVTLRRNADIAAALGVELFTVDLGWSRAIGDWYEDPAKFPSGLAALSDYVHSLGMKFGLHFALAEADPNSPVLQTNADWTSTDSGNYFGASSLCLSNQPTQDWLVQQGIRIIDDYGVDWLLQDGENMVKQCTKDTHTHDSADSNYANSVQGINAVVSAIQKARPNVYWENCENGGSMMTFNMVKHYVTSITNDASGSLPSRKAVYGATYPFSPRYAARYMPASDGMTPYATHSYRFGGNWVLMNRLTDLSADQGRFLAQEIAHYKSQRANISSGKVYHILPPTFAGMDVIESYNPEADSAIAIVTRAAAGAPSYTFHPQGLIPTQIYAVSFEISPDVFLQPGSQLMNTGIRVTLPIPYTSEIVHIDRQP